MDEIKVGDLIELRKTHPCGGKVWEVVRIGLDIGLVCQKCGRKVFIPRMELAGRVRAVIPAQNPKEKENADIIS